MSLVEEALLDAFIRINAAIAQKGPVAPDVFQMRQVHGRRKEFPHDRWRPPRESLPAGRRGTSRPRIPGRRRRLWGFRGPRDSPPPRKVHWRWRGRAAPCATNRVAPRHSLLSRWDASRSPWDKKEFTRLATPPAARLPDTIGPSKSACRFCLLACQKRESPDLPA